MGGRGRFISVEGGEGVGKSLFLASLAAQLKSAGRRLLSTREPGGTAVGDCIRGLFGAPPAGETLLIETEALLVSAARAQHVGQVIEPALARGDWVLCDRYHDSMRVYQGLLGGIDQRFLEELIAGSTKGLDPDVTFLLDCDVAVARSRIARRAAKVSSGQVRTAAGSSDTITRYDDIQTAAHERLRQGFLGLKARFPQRIAVLDAGRPPDAVLADAVRQLEERFPGA